MTENSEIPADLQRIIIHWDSLPKEIKQTITMLVMANATKVVWGNTGNTPHKSKIPVKAT